MPKYALYICVWCVFMAREIGFLRMSGSPFKNFIAGNVWCYTVVLMPYSTCCKLYGDLLSTKL